MATNSQFFSQIQNLIDSVEEVRYHVIPLPNSLHKIGRSAEGFPKFFVVTSDHKMMQNLNAEILSVEYNMLCNIVEGDKEIEEQIFSIITLRSESEQLQKMFVDVFMMMLDMLPPQPTNLMLASKIESLLSIFAKLRKKPVRKLQGLWAEMLLIEQSKSPQVVARAWHSQPDSKYDFTMGADKVEVKSTQSESRIHNFALDQLNPSKNSRLLICSVIVRESAKAVGGLSVFDLYEKISKKVEDSETRMHIYDVMAETLGSDFYGAEKKYFDYIQASDSLALYDSQDVPKIDSSIIPEHVSNVKFASDLSHLIDVRGDDFDRAGSELFNSLY